MSIVRYISDPHFHHKNMAIRRGFSNEHDMNNHIIKSWNNIINKRDVTWILGDVTMEKNNYEILNELNGIKKIILGNHDQAKHVKHMLTYVNSVASCVFYKSKEYGNIVFTHIPIHPIELSYRYKINIHGHVHENDIQRSILGIKFKDKRYINICAEKINYIPKTLKELLNK